MSDETFSPTVERTLHLLEILLAQPQGLTPHEMLAQVDVSRSTLFILLRTLRSLGYVEQSERRGRYRLGVRLEAWRSSHLLAAQDLLTVFYQEAASKSWRETLALLVPSPDGPLALGQSEGSHQVRSMLRIGQVYPHLQAAVEVFQPEPPQQVRLQGYVFSTSPESYDLAIPVCRDGLHPEAALLLSAPAFRWKPEEFMNAFLDGLRTMAARLSYQIGAVLYAPFGLQPQNATMAEHSLSVDEIAQFLRGPWTARLACIRPDGNPHVIPVWHEWNGKQFVLIAWHGSLWADYVLQNPNISLSIDESWIPFRRVVARGLAQPFTEQEMLEEKNALLQRLTQRYLGQNVELLGDQVRVAFRMKPQVLRGWQGTPWHSSKTGKLD